MAVPERVLVTRAPHQGSTLADLLRAFGLEPVLIPAIELAPPARFDPIDQALAELDKFDWIVFTSANAVQVFAERFGRTSLPNGTRIAAIGATTAGALHAAGFRVDLVPPQAVAESLTAVLVPEVRRSEAGVSRFLLIRAEEGRDLLPESLREAGAEVTVAPAYRTVIAQSSVESLRQLFTEQGNQLRAITFTSASTVRNLLALCQAADVDLPKKALRVSIGPITSAALQEAGYPAVAEAPEATMKALAKTVAEAVRAEAASPRD